MEDFSKTDELLNIVNQHAKEVRFEEENKQILRMFENRPQYDDENRSSLVSNSVGNKTIPKVKKKRPVKIIIITALAMLTIASAIKVNQINKPYNEALESYVTMENHESFDTSDEATRYELEEIGQEIANSIIEKSQKSINLDPNMEVIIGMGLAVDKINNKVIEYPNKDAFYYNDSIFNPGWAQKMYTEIRESLLKAGIIELPEKLEDYLIANGFDGGEVRFNRVTGKYEVESAEEVSLKQMLINLYEFAQAKVVDTDVDLNFGDFGGARHG